MRFPYLLLALWSIRFVAVAQTPAPVPTPASAASNGSKSVSSKPSFIPFPILFSQPETGFGYGLAVLPVYRFGADTLTRPSNARLLLYRTSKG